MGEGWYRSVEPGEALTQGDLIFGCPILRWKDAVRPTDLDQLKGSVQIVQADVVVVTQACDLEQDKVSEVTLCAHASLAAHRQRWEAGEQARGQKPTVKAWRRHCDRLRQGFAWNAAMLERTPTLERVAADIRVVDFLRVFTLPRSFLDSLVGQPNIPRLRLQSPYREHLSQSFARFYMRVGLPTGVARSW